MTFPNPKQSASSLSFSPVIHTLQAEFKGMNLQAKTNRSHLSVNRVFDGQMRKKASPGTRRYFSRQKSVGAQRAKSQQDNKQTKEQTKCFSEDAEEIFECLDCLENEGADHYSSSFSSKNTQYSSKVNRNESLWKSRGENCMKKQTLYDCGIIRNPTLNKSKTLILKPAHNKCRQKQQLLLEVEEKNKQLLIMSHEIQKLKNINLTKQSRIEDLEQQVCVCRANNELLQQQISRSYANVRHYIGQYSSADTVPVVEGRKLDIYIQEELTHQFHRYLAHDPAALEHIIAELRNKIYDFQSSLPRLEIRSSLFLKFKAENGKLKSQNDRLTHELSQIRNRYQSLNSEHDALRISNAKLKKSISNMKKSHEKQIQQTRKFTYEDELMHFSLGKEQNDCRSKQKEKMCEKFTHVESDTEYSQKSEQDNHSSMNISDVSTEELMEMEDMF